MTHEQDLRIEVEALLKEVKSLLLSHKWNISEADHKAKWDDMVAKAVKLHQLVKPKHHKYMIENRRYSPDEPGFYNHIHPIEDLIAFMDDPHANDDPEDVTIDHEFTLYVYSRRWRHKDCYRLKRTKTGWELSHISISDAKCDKSGIPYLFENLNHDSINYPEELPGYMSWLWEQAAERGLTHDQVQESLNELGNWISICEENSPKGIWEAYK